jgi:hypothetical protein
MSGDPVIVRRAAGVGLAVGVAAALVAVVLAACSTPETLACPTATSSTSPACPSLDGVTSFCTWSQWGCAPVAACGGYFVLQDQGTDARFTYYYAAASGELVATVKEGFNGGGASCIAGPESFRVPSGCAMDTLADCAPPPRDGGIGGGDDATVDAPFSAPSPSGMPSNQPFVLAPGR